MRSPSSSERSSQDDVPTQRRGTRTTQQMVADNKGPGFVKGSLHTLAGLAVAVAIGAAIFFGAAAIEGDDPSPLAPWSSESAPTVGPAPLVDQ